MKQVFPQEPEVDRFTKVDLGPEEYVNFRTRAGQAEKSAHGPGTVWFTKTKTGSVNGTPFHTMIVTRKIL